MLACLLFNALEAAGTIVWSTVKQRHVPAAPARARLQPRLADLDQPAPRLVRPHRPGRQLVGVRATLVGAGLIGSAATLGALFLPGMRDVEGRIAPGAAAATATAGPALEA